MRKCEFCHFVNDLWSIRCCWILMDICSTLCLTVFIRWLLSVETNNKRNLSLLTPKLPATSFTAHSSDTRQRASRKKQHSKSVNTSKIVNNMMQYIHFTNGMLQKKYRFDSKTTNTAGVFIWKKQNLNQWCLFIYFFNFFFLSAPNIPWNFERRISETRNPTSLVWTSSRLFAKQRRVWQSRQLWRSRMRLDVSAAPVHSVFIKPFDSRRKQWHMITWLWAKFNHTCASCCSKFPGCFLDAKKASGFHTSAKLWFHLVAVWWPQNKTKNSTLLGCSSLFAPLQN